MKTTDVFHCQIREFHDLPEGTALSQPVPTVRNERANILVFRFTQPITKDRELLYPPEHLYYFDFASNELLMHRSCKASDIIPGESSELLNGFGLQSVSDQQFWQAVETVKTLSPLLWNRYFTHNLDTYSRQLAREYAKVFECSTYVPLRKFYQALAPEFFAWISALSDRAYDWPRISSI